MVGRRRKTEENVAAMAARRETEGRSLGKGHRLPGHVSVGASFRALPRNSTASHELTHE